MRIMVIAAGDFALPTLGALHQSTHKIPLVITQPDRRSGRGRRLTPTPVNRLAGELGLCVVTASNVNETDVVERVAACRADVGVVIDFGQKIGPAFRNAIRGGCVNLHASLLPAYRGAAPFQWAIMRGERSSGVTVFKLVDRMDAGPILTARTTTIGQTETADELHDRLADLGPAAVIDALEQFEGGCVPQGVPQDDRQATTAPKLKKQDGRVDFAAAAATVVRRICGLWSWPGAACRFQSADGSRNEVVTLARAKIVERAAPHGEPGVLTENLHVAAADAVIEILEIKPQSGKLMPWGAYVNGRHVKPADRFVPI
ncbi:MAG: methionyl-tRNA formyltransferase [Phycisphaerae bacterium]